MAVKSGVIENIRNVKRNVVQPDKLSKKCDLKLPTEKRGLYES